MNKLEIINSEWQSAYELVLSGGGLSVLLKGRHEPKHYRALLREIYYLEREGLRFQMSACPLFVGRQRDLVADFLSDVLGSIKSERRILADLTALGEDVLTIPYVKPRVTTQSLIALVYRKINIEDPLSVLGYLIHHENFFSRTCESLIFSFESSAISKGAFQFLNSKRKYSKRYIRSISKWIEEQIQTQEQFDAVVQMAQASIQMTGFIVQELIESAALDHLSGVDHKEIQNAPPLTTQELVQAHGDQVLTGTAPVIH